MEEYRLNDAQMRIVEVENAYGSNKCNNLGIYAIAQNEISLGRIEEAVNECIKELDGFRVRIDKKQDKYCQYFYPFKFEKFDRFDFTGQSEKMNNYLEEKMSKNYFILNHKLYDITLGRNNEGLPTIVLVLHHAIADAWSLVAIFSENVGRKLSNIEQKERGSFEEYLQRQKYKKKSEKTWKYWKHKIENYTSEQINVAQRFTDISCKRRKFILSKEETQFFSQEIAKVKTTMPRLFMMSMVLLEVWENNRTNVSIGMAHLGRSGRKERNIFGAFSKLLPLMLDIDRHSTCREFVEKINVEVHGLLRYSEQSYDEIQNYSHQLNKKGNYLDVCYSYQNALYCEDILKSFQDIIWLHPLEQFNDLTVHVSERSRNETLSFEYDYNIKHYTDSELELYHSRIIHIAKELLRLLEDDKSTLEDINYMLPEEKEKIDKFNYYEDEDYQDVVTLFENVVNRYGEKIALGSSDLHFTYSQVNQLVNRIANGLTAAGVKPGDAVAISGEKSIYAPMQMLGILKVGAYYIPIDRKYPTERKKFILNETDAKYILVGKKKDVQKTGDIPVLIAEELSQYGDDTNPGLKHKNSDLAYIIYTSGTSGTPKGTLIEHQSIVRLVHNTEYIKFSSEQRYVATGSIAFDASTFEYYAGLLNGGYVYICDEDEVLSSEILEKVIRQEKINTIFLTSALFNQFVDVNPKMFNGIKELLTGGERISEYHVKKLLDLNSEIQVFNCYGPTENTTFTTVYKIPNNFKNLPIGKPIRGTQCYIMRGNKQCGIGSIGELCVTGKGVARGYLNRPQLTSEKFQCNPFGKGLMYRTGDLARWLPDGFIDFVGRIDQQVKIRGFRVELGDIEAQLRNEENIRNAVVIHKEEQLIAYIVLEERESIDIDEINQHLYQKIPEYMIPQVIEVIDEIPMTINGKVDIKALPKINIVSKNKYVSPRCENEKVICDVLAKVLGVTRIGIDERFFELGGDSIKAIRVISNLRSFGLKLEISDIIKYQTVRALSDNHIIHIEENYVEQDGICGYVELAPIQQRFFELNLHDKNFFLQSILLEFDEKLEMCALSKAIKILLDRHDMLRAVFNPKQYIQEVGTVDSILIETDRENFGVCLSEWEVSLDITKGPLFAVFFIKDDEKQYLLLRAHHLIVDGVSWRIIVKDLICIYQAIMKDEEYQLPLKTFSYRKWIETQQQFLGTSQAEEDYQYWKQLAEKSSLQNCLFTSNGFKPKTQKFEINISRKKCQSIQIKYQDELGIDSKIFYLSLIGEVMRRWKGTEEISINIEGHGRENLLDKLRLEETVGWFTNKFPMLLHSTGNIRKDMLQNKRLFSYVPHEGISYGILRYMGKKEELNIIGDIVYNFLGEMSLNGEEDSIFQYSTAIKVTDSSPWNVDEEAVSFNIMYLTKDLRILIFYDTSKVTVEEIENLEDIFIHTLKDMEQLDLQNYELNIETSYYDVSDVLLSEQDEVALEVLLEQL